MIKIQLDVPALAHLLKDEDFAAELKTGVMQGYADQIKRRIVRGPGISDAINNAVTEEIEKQIGVKVAGYFSTQYRLKPDLVDKINNIIKDRIDTVIMDCVKEFDIDSRVELEMQRRIKKLTAALAQEG